MSALPIRLIVGLGNPGSEYINTRHNAGFWAIDIIAAMNKVVLKPENKFFGELAKFTYNNQEVLLFKPSTFMNLSGKAVLAVTNFYKIKINEVMVIHDELDFTPGAAKIKFSGGHGGHNGLRDIERVLGRDFWRLRIGIGHPGHKNLVHDYVLKRPSNDDKIVISNAIDKLFVNLKYLISGDFATAQKNIHTKV